MAKIYLLSSKETSSLVRDSLFSRKITEIHRVNSLETLFLNSASNYRLLRDYCGSNKTQQISIQHIKPESLSKCFQEVDDYIASRDATTIGYISEQNNQQELLRLLGEKFDVESIPI